MLQTELNYIREYEAKQTRAWRLCSDAYCVLLKALVSLLYTQAGLKRVQREQEKKNRTTRAVGRVRVSMTGGCAAVRVREVRQHAFSLTGGHSKHFLVSIFCLFYAEKWNHLYRIRSPSLRNTLAFQLQCEISSYLYLFTRIGCSEAFLLSIYPCL